MLCSEGIFFYWKEIDKTAHVVLYMAETRKLLEVALPLFSVNLRESRRGDSVTELLDQKIRIWHQSKGFVLEVEVFDPGRIRPSCGHHWLKLWEIDPKNACATKLKDLQPKIKNELLEQAEKDVFEKIKAECPYYSDENWEKRWKEQTVVDRINEKTAMLAWALKEGSEDLKKMVSRLYLIFPGHFSDIAFLIEKVKPGQVKPGGRVDFSQGSHLNLLDSIMRTIERNCCPPGRDDS